VKTHGLSQFAKAIMMLFNQRDQVLFAKHPDAHPPSKRREKNEVQPSPLVLSYKHLRWAQADSDLTIYHGYKAEEHLSSISVNYHPWTRSQRRT